jgi:chemotaxis protein CheC
MADIFNKERLDTLKELGNIGCANALTALAMFVNRKVTMPVPNVVLVEFRDVSMFVGGPENIICGILVNISGDMDGMMMFLMKMNSARQLVKTILGDMAGSSEGYSFNEMEVSTIQEIGNIMISAYIGSMCGITNQKMRPSVPYMSVDMANAILSVPAIEFSKVADRVLFIESAFTVDGVDISGCFLFVPDMPSLDRMLQALGVQ